jgi:hypothetical protein
MANGRQIVRTVALLLNAGMVLLAAVATVRARYLPPSRYREIFGLLLLAPVSAVMALLLPVTEPPRHGPST